MDIERNLSVDKKLAFNISFIMLLGFFLLACSNRSISNNNPDTDNSNQLNASISNFSETSDPDDIDFSGVLDVEDLTTALEADGYTQDEIMDALDAIISAGIDSSDVLDSCIQFMDLMTILKTSQAEQEPMKEMRDTNSELIRNSLCGDLASSSSFDPGMELSSKFLICPVIPNTAPVIPPGPYDEELGDCALWGKSGEIEAWLTELEQIAASCQANQETNWADALATSNYYYTWIEELTIELKNNGGTVDPDMDGISLEAEQVQPAQLYNEVMEELENDEEYGALYTSLLIRISKNVEKYCTMTDELVKPLWLACDQINFYQNSLAPDPVEYHAILESTMNDAQANYDSAVLYYTDTLQTDGWDDFRLSFSEAALDCSLDSQAPDTKFTFSQNAFCRSGPSSEYEEVATFLEGQVVQIEGRNHHEPRWWVILNPGARGQCWVSDSTGAAEGPLEELEIVAAPPLVINKPTNTCSKDLGESACKAAGGTWADKDTPTPWCDCP